MFSVEGICERAEDGVAEHVLLVFLLQVVVLVDGVKGDGVDDDCVWSCDCDAAAGGWTGGT